MQTHPVLVVDDDFDIRETLIEVLEDYGYSPVGASNGRDALVKLRALAKRPCLILLDLMMPVMDGTAFREEQLKAPDLADIPVVVLSANRDLTDIVQTLGVASHLRKPLKVADLLKVTRQYCEPASHAG